MDADIELSGNTTTVKGDFVKVTAVDLNLDAPGRRVSTSGQRRALVHDFTDGLTLNWSRDYPGGITLNGVVTCPNTLHVDKPVGYGTYDVGATLRSLTDQINALTARVTALES
ncbi:hypothetical protein [Nocardioides sp.]|uniref:hypothetical protein n=1 Tax=Nocardioides sp. TaxID=35761 RepID=UPI002B268509|nr:hypothetical protein [Nocardioides sp.]